MHTDPPRRFRPIKVLHVTSGLEPELGGPTVAIVNYMAATAHSSVESHLVTAITDKSSPLATQLGTTVRSAGGEISFLNRTGRFTGRVGRWGISFPLLQWLARRAKDFDLIVIHGAWSFSSVAALATARLACKPCILVPHESLTEFDVNRKGSSVRIAAKTRLKQIYGRHCQMFVFTSDAEAADSFPHGSAASSAVLRYPVFDDRNGVSRDPRRRSESPLRVGFLGRLHPKKNVDVVLEMMALLPENVSLVIGGDGPTAFRSTLEKLAEKLRIQHRVTWKGFVSADQKDNFFDSVDLLLMPSDFESFGIVAAEAMMRGVPAIVSPNTGAAELIREGGGGMVVEPTPEALAETVTRLGDNHELMQQLSVQGIRATSEHLSFTSIGARLLGHYRDLVKRQSH